MPPETLAGIAAAALAQHRRPVRLPASARPAGWAMLCTGICVVVSAVRERGPGALEDPDTLVTWGLHSRSRNPMYLGVSVAQLGLAGASRNAWMLASSAVSGVLLHRSILREERWLDRRFGPDYDTYRAEVPRWW